MRHGWMWDCKRPSVVHIIFVILYTIFCTWVVIRGDIEHKKFTIPFVLWFVNVINMKYHSTSSFSALLFRIIISFFKIHLGNK